MERYTRNIQVSEIGQEGQEKLLSSRILVCGCGGLGSTVVANLASLGVGNIGLVDDDEIEVTNLNRQYIHKFKDLGKSKVISAKEWIENFNPDVFVKTYDLRLDEKNCDEIVKDYDLIIDCFDSYSSKFLLNDIAIKSSKTLIHGGITEFYGQVTTIVPYETPCLRCLVPEADMQSFIPKGVISPAVSLIASIEAMEAVKMILNIGTPLTNTLLTVNALTSEFKKLKITKNSECKICS